MPKFKLFVFTTIQVLLLLHLQIHHFILLLTLKQILKEKKYNSQFFFITILYA
jgi:hypothetical protein